MESLVIEGCAVATVDGATTNGASTADPAVLNRDLRAAARALAGRHRVRR